MKTCRRFFIPSIVLLFGFASVFSSWAQEGLTQIIKRIQPAAVIILTYDNNGNILGQGSGFFLSKNGEIITNYHVLKGASQAIVRIKGEKTYPITRILAEDIEGDLIRAAVDIPQELVYPLTVSDSTPEAGERIIVIGNPLGLEQTVSDGIVSAVREIPGFGKIIQITAPLSAGSSGSPVVNMKGEVIGVATFQIIEGQNLNFAIPGERISKLKPVKAKTLAEWTGGVGDGLDTAEGLYSLGLGFVWAEDYEKALLYFEEAVKQNPRHAEAYFILGIAMVSFTATAKRWKPIRRQSASSRIMQARISIWARLMVILDATPKRLMPLRRQSESIRILQRRTIIWARLMMSLAAIAKRSRPLRRQSASSRMMLMRITIWA